MWFVHCCHGYLSLRGLQPGQACFITTGVICFKTEFVMHSVCLKCASSSRLVWEPSVEVLQYVICFSSVDKQAIESCVDRWWVRRTFPMVILFKTFSCLLQPKLCMWFLQLIFISEHRSQYARKTVLSGIYSVFPSLSSCFVFFLFCFGREYMVFLFPKRPVLSGAFKTLNSMN